mgnify:CR=1 FL=1
MLCPSPTVVVQAIRTRVKDAAMPIVAVRFRLPIMNWELKVLDSVRGDGRRLRWRAMWTAGRDFFCDI